MNEQFTSVSMPVLALRGLAIYPEQTVHFDVGRPKSVLALETAMKKDQTIFLVPQKNIVFDDPDYSGLVPIGTVAKIKQVLKTQGENIRVLVTGIYRAKIVGSLNMEPHLSACVEEVRDVRVSDSLRSRLMRREANGLYAQYLELIERPSQTVQLKIMSSQNNGFIADTIAQNSGFDYEDKSKILCTLNPDRRLDMVLDLLRQEIRMIQLESDIQEKTKAHIDQDQRDYYLREQMKAIREELGESDDHSEFAEYEKNKEVTRKRLFFEAMEEILPSMEVVIENSDGTTEKIYPVKPFTEGGN